MGGGKGGGSSQPAILPPIQMPEEEQATKPENTELLEEQRKDKNKASGTEDLAIELGLGTEDSAGKSVGT